MKKLSLIASIANILFCGDDTFTMSSKDIVCLPAHLEIKITRVEATTEQLSSNESSMSPEELWLFIRSRMIIPWKTFSDFIEEGGRVNFASQYLCFDKIGLTSLEGMPSFPAHNTNLSLSQNRLKTLKYLPYLPYVENLSVNCNQINDLNPLRNVPDLTWLDVSDNHLSDFTSMPRLIKLNHLWADDNCLRDFSGLENLLSLTYLTMCRNQISKLKNMPKKLLRLERLNLSYNFLENLIGLPEMPNLLILILEGNPLKSLVGMPNLSKLLYLYLNYNELESLDGLPGNLPDLYSLDLRCNRLKNLKNLPPILPNLHFLDLTYNQLENLDDLPEMPMLEELRISENPLSKDALMRAPWRKLPNLKEVWGINKYPDADEIFEKIEEEINRYPRTGELQW
ncbi:MAG: hypothetical protein IJA14_02215 [Alphaproteobacteria bacterium]|nr:hypothetical protein [Alphaproteobacteria bacterium]